MSVSKDFDKLPNWSKIASELDNVAYELYLEQQSHMTVYSQDMIIEFHRKIPQVVSELYKRAKKTLRQRKLQNINKTNGYTENSHRIL